MDRVGYEAKMIRNYEFFENYYWTHNLPKIQYFYNILMLLSNNGKKNNSWIII